MYLLAAINHALFGIVLSSSMLIAGLYIAPSPTGRPEQSH
jgi:hypothetical protein